MTTLSPLMKNIKECGWTITLIAITLRRHYGKWRIWFVDMLRIAFWLLRLIVSLTHVFFFFFGSLIDRWTGLGIVVLSGSVELSIAVCSDETWPWIFWFNVALFFFFRCKWFYRCRSLYDCWNDCFLDVVVGYGVSSGWDSVSSLSLKVNWNPISQTKY